jgi:hypothetical protein
MRTNSISSSSTDRLSSSDESGSDHPPVFRRRARSNSLHRVQASDQILIRLRERRSTTTSLGSVDPPKWASVDRIGPEEPNRLRTRLPFISPTRYWSVRQLRFVARSGPSWWPGPRTRRGIGSPWRGVRPRLRPRPRRSIRARAWSGTGRRGRHPLCHPSRVLRDGENRHNDLQENPVKDDIKEKDQRCTN